ncbi:MAG: TonB family protein [SAR86 cluster bacterium]|uniref:TonB family protein n=1 Tax=SAR86 cluster bacterium TaxID=2030880 RepID=A0A520N696_9GAMM|nr:MAG: TonB family protein [SAR86 cluster bacterium]
MKVNKVYLEASFVSFIIHGIIILYLLGFFYFESQQSSVLSKPINVNLIFEQPNIKNNNKTQVKKIEKNVNESSQTIAKSSKAEESISFDSLIESISPEDLLKEDVLISLESEQNQIEIYSSLIIQTVQSAWRKPINIQDNLVCDLRISVNKNGRVINTNLIKSSGNIRFDNSALKAVERVETFNFFDRIPMNIYSSNFKNIVITFNPS